MVTVVRRKSFVIELMGGLTFWDEVRGSAMNDLSKATRYRTEEDARIVVRRKIRPVWSKGVRIRIVRLKDARLKTEGPTRRDKRRVK